VEACVLNRNTNIMRGNRWSPITLVLAMLVAVASMVTVNATPAAAAPSTPYPQHRGDEIGPYYLKNYHSGRCIDVPGGSMADYVKLDQWTCVNQTNVRWKLRWAGWVCARERCAVSFYIVNTHSGKCIIVPGASRANGTQLIQYPCHVTPADPDAWGHDAWHWLVMDGRPLLMNLMSMKCISVAGASMNNGAALIQDACTSATNKAWNAVPR
jgi:hypothetical protein